jgi:hypothetical protein
MIFSGTKQKINVMPAANDQFNAEDQMNNESEESRKKQQQSDPQLTELKGFVDPNEKIEPDLVDDESSTKESE